MPRHVEYPPYSVKPVHARPGAGAKEAERGGPSFAKLLAEAEAIQDAVHITAPNPIAGFIQMKSAGGLVAAATGLWHGLGGVIVNSSDPEAADDRDTDPGISPSDR